MALKLITTLNINLYLAKQTGLNNAFDSVYLKIEKVHSNKEKCTLEVSSYLVRNESAEAYDTEGMKTIISNEVKSKLYSNSYSFVPVLEGDNFIRQGYEYLKTLEEFKEFEDC